MMLPSLKAAIKRIPLARRTAALIRRWQGIDIEGLERNRQYDLQTVEVIRRVLAPDATGVDVGAHSGAILAQIAAAAPAGVHYAFEPIPALAQKLRSRFLRVRVHECALCEQCGHASFEHVVNDPGYSGLRPRDYDRPNPKIEQIRVATDTLDNVIPTDATVGFIKIDVEGGEYHVLLGGTRMIERCRPVIVFEASVRSTGRYGVSASDMYRLITERFGMKLSTMARWLARQESFTEDDFAKNWLHGPEFYFIAYPECSVTSPQRKQGPCWRCGLTYSRFAQSPHKVGRFTSAPHPSHTVPSRFDVQITT
jgi:FkbM family methyltransferase